MALDSIQQASPERDKSFNAALFESAYSDIPSSRTVSSANSDRIDRDPTGNRNEDIVKRLGLAPGSVLLASADDIQNKVADAADLANKVNVATFGTRANNPFYNPSMGVLGIATGVDVTPDFISGVVKSSFERLGDINRALGDKSKDPKDYKPVIDRSTGKPAAIGAKDGWWGSPTLTIGVDKQERSIDMNLPGFPKDSKNVLLLTDKHEHHLLAVDPNSKRVWALNADRLSYFWNEVGAK